ncbi:MAG: hypothetical protein M1823_004057 [Watsoniomyces obsoletus]|nr:MAG: hypothetical protein M1823_004057 [Watsoniomyces obsoletus]
MSRGKEVKKSKMSPSDKQRKHGQEARAEDGVTSRHGMNRELTVAVAQGQVDFFIKQHPFIHDPLVHHSVSERRNFTREVYDYARRHGLNSLEAQQAIQVARKDYRKKRHLAKVLAWVDEAAQSGRSMEDAISDIREEHGWDTDEMEGDFDTDDEGTNFGSEVDELDQPPKLSAAVTPQSGNKWQQDRSRGNPVPSVGRKGKKDHLREEGNPRFKKNGQKDQQERRPSKKDRLETHQEAEEPKKVSPKLEKQSKKRKKQQESRPEEEIQPERPLKRSKRLAAQAQAGAPAAADTHRQDNGPQAQTGVATSNSSGQHDPKQKKLNKLTLKEKKKQKREAKAARKAERDGRQVESDPPIHRGQEEDFRVNIIERGPSQHMRAATAPVGRSESHPVKAGQHKPKRKGAWTKYFNNPASAGVDTQGPPHLPKNSNSIPLGPRRDHTQNIAEKVPQTPDFHDALLANARKTVEPHPVPSIERANNQCPTPANARPPPSNVSQAQPTHTQGRQAPNLRYPVEQLLRIKESTPAIKPEEDVPPPHNNAILPTPSSQPPQPSGYQSVLPTPAKPSTTRVPSTSPYFLTPRHISTRGQSCIPFPPISHPRFGLIQESVACNPFQLVIGVNFLNRTRGMQAIPAFYNMIVLYPTPKLLSEANELFLARQIQHLGLQNIRARRFIDIARAWDEAPPTKGQRYRILHYPEKGDGRDIRPREVLTDEDPRIGAWEIAHIPSIGPYALDSWRIFCRDEVRGLASGWNGEGAPMGFEPEWKRVVPKDKELRAFLRWMWLKEGVAWDPLTGNTKPADEELMKRARTGGMVWDPAERESESGNSMPLVGSGSRGVGEAGNVTVSSAGQGMEQQKST